VSRIAEWVIIVSLDFVSGWVRCRERTLGAAAGRRIQERSFERFGEMSAVFGREKAADFPDNGVCLTAAPDASPS
jgi:hypothetical protein